MADFAPDPDAPPEHDATSRPPSTAPAIHGRGASTNPPNRFEKLHLTPDPDADLGPDISPAPDARTQFFHDVSATILSRNDSPDIPYTYGLNPYRGCEHGCAYCYARPGHNYLGWGSGLDFETRILVKLRAPALLRDALAKPGWQPESIAMSGVTDCYQPCERHFRLTRGCLEVFTELRHPVSIVTKNALVTRDLDLLSELARYDCTTVFITLTTLDADLAGKLEPRAARPELRLRAIRDLHAAGVPVGVMVAPIIPGLTDHEMPAILAAAAAAGARHAGKVILRLPWSVKDVFLQWLDQHAPSKKDRVLSRVREIRGGELNVSDWGARLRGEGIFAEQIHELFTVAARRAGLSLTRRTPVTNHFRRPGGTQLSLF